MSNKKGMAMIMVLCIMAVFTALSFGLLLSASTVIHTAQKTAINQRCKVAAASFGKMMGNDLVNEEGTLAAYLRQQIESGSWQYYDVANSSASAAAVTRSFQVSSGTEATLETEPIANTISGYDIGVKMYWQANKSDLESKLNDGTPNPYDGITLVVSVISSKGKESYTFKTRYELKCTEESGGVQWAWKTKAVG